MKFVLSAKGFLVRYGNGMDSNTFRDVLASM